jgi:NAD+ diphosphatase
MRAMARRNYFSTEAFDRSGHLRRDPEWLNARLADTATRLLLLRRSLIPVNSERRLMLVAAVVTDLDHAADGVVFLGLDPDGSAVFAVDVDGDGRADLISVLPEGHTFVELRGAAASLPRDEGHRAAYASAMLTWHRRHRWCGTCGAPTVPDWAGHIRRCTGCGAEHFPRTDPVIIVVVTAGDHCLLGRQAAWPTSMFSALAGFVEPGESLEDAVAREVWEETGVRVSDVVYNSSQPWPFPLSLMLGFHASAGDKPVDVTVDETEIEDARWFTRDELAKGIADGGLTVPPPFSIARTIIDAWLEEGA